MVPARSKRPVESKINAEGAGETPKRRQMPSAARRTVKEAGNSWTHALSPSVGLTRRITWRAWCLPPRKRRDRNTRSRWCVSQSSSSSTISRAKGWPTRSPDLKALPVGTDQARNRGKRVSTRPPTDSWDHCCRAKRSSSPSSKYRFRSSHRNCRSTGPNGGNRACNRMQTARSLLEPQSVAPFRECPPPALRASHRAAAESLFSLP